MCFTCAVKWVPLWDGDRVEVQTSSGALGGQSVHTQILCGSSVGLCQTAKLWKLAVICHDCSGKRMEQRSFIPSIRLISKGSLFYSATNLQCKMSGLKTRLSAVEITQAEYCPLILVAFHLLTSPGSWGMGNKHSRSRVRISGLEPWYFYTLAIRLGQVLRVFSFSISSSSDEDKTYLLELLARFNAV